MHLLFRLGFFSFIALLGSTALNAQCTTWNDLPNKDAIEEAHALYREFINSKTQVADIAKLTPDLFQTAQNNWEKAYAAAPAADGKRDYHYTDGAKIQMHLFSKATDDAEKQQYLDRFIQLYDEAVACVEAGSITSSKRTPEKHVGKLRGDQGFHMFYTLNTSYDLTQAALEEALEKSGNDMIYTQLEPLARVIVFQYKNKRADGDKTRSIYQSLMDIADYNIENNKNYGQYYEDTKARVETVFAEVASDLFDCAYWKKKLIPLYEENPEDLDNLKYVYNKLKQEGCEDNDPDLQSVKTAYESKAASINAELEAERRRTQPGYDAVQLQKEKKYDEAAARYKEAIAQETDPEAKAQYLYSLAFIQTWQFGKYSTARENVRKAVALKSGWGKPYILWGDIYAKASRGCGDDWNARLAVLAAIDKYAYAKSIDSSVAGDANKRIGNYSSAKPTKEEGFMRKVKAGQKVKVKCWIGETVTVRYQ